MQKRVPQEHIEIVASTSGLVVVKLLDDSFQLSLLFLSLADLRSRPETS